MKAKWWPKYAHLPALVLFTSAAWLSTTLHGLLAAQAPPPPAADYDLAAPTVRLLAFNLRQAAADVAYLRAVGHFGDKAAHAQHYPALAPLLQQSVAIDPNFAAPYLLAGTALLLGGNDDAAGMALLRQGSRQLPHVWQIAFYRGFHAYYVQHDFDEAAQALAAAARLPDAPAFVGPLATRVAARSHDPAAGLALLDSLRASTDDDGVRATLKARRPLLVLERRLAALQATANAAFQASRAAHASKTVQAGQAILPNEADHAVGQVVELADLAPWWGAIGEAMAQEPLTSASQDPLGGYFLLDPNGLVRTVHESERLDVYRDAKDTRATQDKTSEDAVTPPAAKEQR